MLFRARDPNTYRLVGLPKVVLLNPVMGSLSGSYGQAGSSVVSPCPQLAGHALLALLILGRMLCARDCVQDNFIACAYWLLITRVASLQPFISLALELRKGNHRIRIASHAQYRSFIEV